MRKKVYTPPSAEESVANELKRLREEYTNEPTILYKIGDRIVCGALENCIVTQVEGDGRYVKFHCEYNERHHGTLERHEKDMWVPWHHIVPYRDPIEYPPQISERSLLHYSNVCVSSIMNHYYGAGLDMNPPYQREIVWDMENKIALIDSIFNNVDIGKFVIARRKWSHKGPLYEIIDGKQRLNTLIEFTESRWKWRGRFFHELHPWDMRHVEDYPVAEAQLDEPTMQQILDVFLRLNTTGKPMQHEHLERVRKMAESL